MASIGEVRRRIPNDFIESMNELFSPGTVDNILIGMMNNRLTTLRVNTLKSNIQEVMKYFKEKNIKFDRVPWYNDALVIKNCKEKDIQKLDIYEKGHIYLQSLSSMVPPIALMPKPGEKVLDLTAAPGSKTTQMAAMMENKGEIIANEIDKIRCERLLHNVNVQGASIVEVLNGRGEKLSDTYSECFDRVLLDAPCSGEGRFLVSDVRTYRSWSLREVRTLSNLQKKLFLSAYKALKKGGVMVYSTCTLNKDENEYVLDWALKNLNVEIVDVGVEIREAINGFTEDVDKNIKKAIKILPSKNMEGFFVCKLRKL